MKPQAIIRECFRKTVFPAFAVALLLVPDAAMALPMYTITDLGDLPGGFDQSVATGINNSGQVVGNSHAATGGGWTGHRAFLWDSVNGMTDLGALPPDRDRSYATGINDHGQVVGASDSAYANRRAFLWESGTGMTDLGDLAGGAGDDLAHATGINDQGQVVGQSYAATGYRAFLWDRVNGMTNLGDLPGGVDHSAANGINDHGQVVGYSSAITGDRAFLWDKVNGMIDLGDLPGGVDFSVATGVSNNGQVVGYSGAGTGYGARAFLWDSVTGMTDLGDLQGGSNESVAFGVNDSGQVVGASQTATRSSPFLWNSVNGMLDLNDLLTNSAGWNLGYALAINNSGQIVGAGGHNGASRAFLLTPVDASPPPPVTINNIHFNSNQTPVVDNFDPLLPTVIITHGWQDALPLGQNFTSQDFPLSDVSDAVAARALEDGQSINLITYQWEGAYTKDGLPSPDEYNDAAIGIQGAGYTLGSVLNNLFDNAGYTGAVHLIGHSLGAAVNARAVNLFPSLDVEQFTILDAVSDPPFENIWSLNFTSEWFNETLSSQTGEGLVTYVDNFYGTGQGINPQGINPAVGTSIYGAAPNGGLGVAFADHTEIHTEFYSPRIGSGSWVSPIFGLDHVNFLFRPGPQIWDPLTLSDLNFAAQPLNDLPSWVPITGLVEITTLDIGGTAGTTAMVLVPQSPVSVSHPFDIPGDATLLSFDFGFLDPGTGEFLQLFFDDILLWETAWMNDLVGELLHAVVPIGSLAGLSGDLTFLLDSTTGDASARAFLTNFEVMGQFARTASVPEPGTVFLLGTGLLGLTGMRLRRAARLQKLAA